MEVDSMGIVTGNNASGIIQNVAANTTTNTTDLTVDQTLEPNRFENGRITVSGTAYAVVSNTTNVITISGTSTPPLNSMFTLVDDDDFNSNDANGLRGDESEAISALSDTFSLMQNSDDPTKNVYASAYIRPDYDGGGNAANNGNVPFVLNNPPSADVNAIVNQIDNGRNSGPNESDGFWVVYVQIRVSRARSNRLRSQHRECQGRSDAELWFY